MFKAIFGIETPAPRPQARAIAAGPYVPGALKNHAEPEAAGIVRRPYEPGALKTLARQLGAEGGE